MKTHLFLVMLHNSGSTLLHNLIKTSKSVVTLPIEGDMLIRKEAKPFMNPIFWQYPRIFSEIADKFEDPESYNWKGIKQFWKSYWKKDPRYQNLVKRKLPIVFLEKSSPNIYRAELLEKEFENSHFLVVTRNPYAIIEGTRRRMAKKNYGIERITEHCLKAMEKQAQDIAELKQVIWFSYEDLCDKTKEVKEKIKSFIPTLSDINIAASFKIHSLEGRKSKPIANFNVKQIAKLSKGELIKINKILGKKESLLNSFGYAIIE